MDAPVYTGTDGDRASGYSTLYRDKLTSPPYFEGVGSHQGVDIVKDSGGVLLDNRVEVHPICSGQIWRITKWGCEDNGFGNSVVLRHTVPGLGDVFSAYLHLENNDSFARDLTCDTIIDETQLLGTVDTTGEALGLHLHFQVDKDFTDCGHPFFPGRKSCPSSFPTNRRGVATLQALVDFPDTDGFVALHTYNPMVLVQQHAAAMCERTERVSVASDGSQADYPTPPDSVPTLSADGRFVAFSSDATNLVPGDTNGKLDVYVHDRLNGTTERVSVASDGSQGNNASWWPNVSADGRFVAFVSAATNLIPGDTKAFGWDVFVHDRLIGTTERVSVASDGSQADASSYAPALSADGRFVVFTSDATNLIPGDTNGRSDIFVHDRLNGTTERVSVASDGSQTVFNDVPEGFMTERPSISADGRFVVFSSDATNLVPRDTEVYRWDVFVHDRLNGTTERVSVASDGSQGNNASAVIINTDALSLSADGRFAAFDSPATNLVPGDTNVNFDVFVHDRLNGTTERVSVASDGSQGNNGSWSPSLSADGRFVAFQSSATNLVPGDTNGRTDVFVHDRLSGTTERVSVAADGSQGNNNAGAGLSFSGGRPALSADGRFAVFVSAATNLIPGDTNGRSDIFVHDRACQ